MPQSAQPTRTPWFRRGASCALLFSLLSTVWLLLVVGQSAKSSRRASATLLPLVAQTQVFEREILLARVGFIYYVTIDKAGSLDEGWSHFGAAHASLQRMEHSLPLGSAADDPLRHRLADLQAAWDIYEQRLSSMLALVGSGNRAGALYDTEVNEWAAAGERLVARGRDLQSGSQAFLSSEVQNTSFLLRLSLAVLAANGLVWVVVSVLAFADHRIARGGRPDQGELRSWLMGRGDAAIAVLRRHAAEFRTYGGWTVMAAAVLALVVTGFFALHGISVLTAQQQWVTHSQEVLIDSQSLRTAIYRAESATRVFIFSGSPTHLAEQAAAMHDARAVWDRLFHETSDNADQQARLRRVLEMLDARFGSMLWVDDAFRAGGVAAVRGAVGTGQNRRYQVALENRIADFDSAEQQLLIERRLGAEHQAAVSKALIGFVALPAALGLGILGVLTTQSLRRNTELREQMSHLAYHDPLTGLPNRLQLKVRFDGLLQRAGRNGGIFAVLGIDLDHFKEVNDRWGHEAGDQFLQGVVARLNSVLRSSDSLLRIGGDEFLCLLDALRSPEDASLVAEKLIGSLREPIAVGGVLLDATVSIGVAIHPADGNSAEELQRKADAALYAAKAAGRNCFRTSVDLAQDSPPPVPVSAIRSVASLAVLST